MNGDYLSHESKCSPYKIINTQGVSIGFFSLVMEDFPLITLEEGIKLKNTNLIVAQNMVKILKDETFGR